MRLFNLKTMILLAGITLIAWGYHLLGVSPDAAHEEVMTRARNGMFCVVGGGAFLMLWLARR